ncbi:MAG: hypothetical protein AAGA70_12855 [Pseudomonadota bacterium]
MRRFYEVLLIWLQGISGRVVPGALLTALILALGAQSPAAAQVALGSHEAFQTRFGHVSVVAASEFEEELAWNNQRLGLRNRFVVIAGAWGLPNVEIDWVLIETNHGGNMCPGTYYLGLVDPLGIQISPPFGECLGRILDLEVLPDRIELVLAHPDVSIDQQRVVFDGLTLSATDDAPVLGDGQAELSDPTQWLSHHPVVALRDGNEQARFLAVMSPDAFQQMARQMTGPGATQAREGWILGSACTAHQCNASAGVWGIRLADGAPAAAILRENAAAETFGAASDPVFARFLAEQPL